MFSIYDRYVMKSLATAVGFATGCLAMIVLLVQSLKLIELIIEANASSSTFFVLMALSLPRLVETVLPISVLAGVLFIYGRMITDNEIVVMRNSGYAVMRLAWPGMMLALFVTCIMFVLVAWGAPMSVANLQKLRGEVKNQFASLMFREGVFNNFGTGLTAYVRQKDDEGHLVGLMLHDTRQVAEGGPTVTIVAKGGQAISEETGQKILVYDGSRQEYDAATGKLSRLDFRKYTIDIPYPAETAADRWREPDERTMADLFAGMDDPNETDDARYQFLIEIHNRLSSLFTPMALALIGMGALLLSPFKRGGQVPPIIIAAVLALSQQGFGIIARNVAKDSYNGIPLMYVASLLPVMAALFIISPYGERALRRFSRRKGRRAAMP